MADKRTLESALLIAQQERDSAVRQFQQAERDCQRLMVIEADWDDYISHGPLSQRIEQLEAVCERLTTETETAQQEAETLRQQLAELQARDADGTHERSLHE